MYNFYSRTVRSAALIERYDSCPEDLSFTQLIGQDFYGLGEG
jgi:hypothetical protein